MINECVSKLSELRNHQVTASSGNELRMHGVMFHSALDSSVSLYDSAVIMHSKTIQQAYPVI